MIDGIHGHTGSFNSLPRALCCWGWRVRKTLVHCSLGDLLSLPTMVQGNKLTDIQGRPWLGYTEKRCFTLSGADQRLQKEIDLRLADRDPLVYNSNWYFAYLVKELNSAFSMGSYGSYGFSMGSVWFMFNPLPSGKGHVKQDFLRLQPHKVLPQSAARSHLIFLVFSLHCW